MLSWLRIWNDFPSVNQLFASVFTSGFRPGQLIIDNYCVCASASFTTGDNRGQTEGSVRYLVPILKETVDSLPEMSLDETSLLWVKGSANS